MGVTYTRTENTCLQNQLYLLKKQCVGAGPAPVPDFIGCKAGSGHEPDR
jgi:hypothetical protein